ncbi:MAG: hypothetical protein ABIH39_02900, partial [Candidatus Margulisiibacteriota bacterium]
MKKTIIFLTMIFLIKLCIVHTAISADTSSSKLREASLCTVCADSQSANLDFNKEALLEKIKEQSLLNDIRWVENKGQLSG